MTERGVCFSHLIAAPDSSGITQVSAQNLAEQLTLFDAEVRHALTCPRVGLPIWGVPLLPHC